ncbi:MAG: lytic transglycosylase domain-containing protein [Granulosicoccus sp.]
MSYFHQNRQKTGTLSVARVTMLCMATTLIVGFSAPKTVVPENSQVSVVQNDGPVMSAARPVLPNTVKKIRVPNTRPSSLASHVKLDSVLGRVSSRRWSKPSAYSPDRAIADLRSRSSRFHGVGFPEIQTHKTAAANRPLSKSTTGQWARMISWRNSEGALNIAEPIAHVRCMGLSPQAVARRADKYNELILRLAMEHDISASLIKAVITEESCFNRKALSPVGAQGLMQLMPDTASWLKVRDPLDPEDNIRAGVKYLASLSKQFDSLELALAAYNAGPGNVRKYGGVPPFAETQAYVRKVKAHYRRYVAASRLASR